MSVFKVMLDTKVLVRSGFLCDRAVMVAFVLWDTSMLHTWSFIQDFYYVMPCKRDISAELAFSLLAVTSVFAVPSFEKCVYSHDL